MVDKGDKNILFKGRSTEVFFQLLLSKVQVNKCNALSVNDNPEVSGWWQRDAWCRGWQKLKRRSMN